MSKVQITEADTGFGPLPGDRNRYVILTKQIAALNLTGRGAAGSQGTVRVHLKSGQELTILCTDTPRAEAIFDRLAGAL